MAIIRAQERDPHVHIPVKENSQPFGGVHRYLFWLTSLYVVRVFQEIGVTPSWTSTSLVVVDREEATMGARVTIAIPVREPGASP
ncbi:hypothetical protein P3102_14535 [Amycolatopsis sp. QT-25]|uniref:hypothetical protein n=1 Tax=Amycolatopsis sp. QT-25 TaxID=3034022 RepID=UPI0023ED6773|nr:hypothetical protein [Amycolatopsis sp. QT-25]WET82331.1 hypothetical protein P3102_14535 [Amycolatopsis sp. QT-25]